MVSLKKWVNPQSGFGPPYIIYIYISYIYIYYTYIKYHVHKVVQHMILANVQEGDPKNQPTHAWFADKFQGCGSHCQSTLKLRFWCPNQSTIGEVSQSIGVIHYGEFLCFWFPEGAEGIHDWSFHYCWIPLLVDSYHFFWLPIVFFQKNTTHQQIPMVPRFLEGAVVPLAYTKAAKASAINRAFHQQKSGNLSRQKWNMNSKQRWLV